VSSPWSSKFLAIALCAAVALTLSCAHRKTVVAPEPPSEAAAQATASATPAPREGTTEVGPEPRVATAGYPESGVTATELPANLEELNKAGYLKDAYFDTNKSELRSDARDALAADASWLKDHPSVKILIEGHCDERNTEEYNLALGWRRANGAKAYLASLGVAADRIATISYGEERPFAMCQDESCWLQNRCAHFVITAR
jgi:peptidoglycan-associated lipoprotein